MAVKRDYLMRMIEDEARLLGKIILGKELPKYELPKEEHYTATDSIYVRLLSMADRGDINKAENQLLEYIDGREVEMLEMALSFYQHVADMEDDFLDEHDYSREEVRDGINELAKACNVSGLEI